MPSDTPSATRVRGSGCPLCGKPSLPKTTPFCSPGCRDRDLLQWLGDGYRMPGPPLGEESLDTGAGLDSDREGP